MDIRQLRDFAAVVDHGTVTAAAQALHLSQPPLSQQLKNLEEELGCALFERSGRRLQLTEAGRLLYPRACAVLDLCSSVEEELSDFRSGGAGTLRLGVVSSVAGTVFLSWLQAFRALHPAVHFDVREGNTYQLLAAVRDRQSELAFVRRPFSAPDLACVPLGKSPLCAVGQSQFLPQKQDFVTLNDLSSVPLVLYRRWEGLLRDAFREQSLRPQILCVADDARTVVAMAEAGLGAAIVPRSVLKPDAALPALPLAQPEFSSEVCAVYRRDGYLSAAAKQFLETAEAAER